MHERLSTQSAQRQAAPTVKSPTPAAPGTPASVLQLQRQAGNRATVAAITQNLSRCGAGGCSCGHCEDEELLGH